MITYDSSVQLDKLVQDLVQASTIVVMSAIELPADALVDVLRAEGSDTTHIEAKRALGGYPTDLAPTLSAFANMPGGGVIVLGLDERDDFAAVGVYDIPDAQRRLGAQARDAVSPPLRIDFETPDIEGQTLVIARVAELDSAHKPCTVSATGRAYLRSYDGDYPISEQERAAFIAHQGPQNWDRRPTTGTAATDLDSALTSLYLANCRGRSARLASMTDHDILTHTRVVDRAGELTYAGLYALGTYPQQFVPTLSVTARVAPSPRDPPGSRSSDIAHFDGPLPELLDSTLSWIRRNTATRIRFGIDGHGRDEPEYPLEAVRELVANALVHRDIGDHALGRRVSVVLEHSRLIISNPGGLWGLTVEQLGRGIGGVARNQSLYDMCKDVRLTDGRRVIEGVGSGIGVVLNSLQRAGMTPPTFLDSGVGFTVIVPNHALLDPDDLGWVAALPNSAGVSDTARHILVALRHGTHWTNKTLREAFPMDSTQARALMADLVERGLAEAIGDRGTRSYRLHPDSGTPLNRREVPLWDDAADRASPTEAAVAPTGRRNNASMNLIVTEMSHGDQTAKDLIRSTGLSPRQVTYSLRILRERGVVEIIGRQGLQNSRYRLTGS